MLQINPVDSMNIFLLGLNHHHASIELREKAAFTPEEIPKILKNFQRYNEVREFGILSTCNRTELYTVGGNSANICQGLKLAFQQARPKLSEEDFEHFYFHQNEKAIRHFFRVAAGINSMVLGEPQILGQIKAAFQLAQKAETTGTYLNRLFNNALVTGKRVRSETPIGEGAVSVAYAAVELAQKIFKNLNRHNALLIGAGKTGELVARHLQEKGIGKIFIANRTFENARKLADDLDGIAYPFQDIQNLLPKVDLIIGSTNAREFIIQAEDIKAALSSRTTINPLFMIDIAVPRDFDPKINQISNVFLHDLDSLQQIIEQNVAKRRQTITLAEKIISEEVACYLKWKKTLQVTPTITALRDKLEEIRKVELRKYQHRSTPEEFDKIERVTRGVINKVLHFPISQLRRYHDENLDAELRVDVLREIFGLDKVEAE